MTWKAAHSFCLQHDSRLANLTDVQVINKTATDGRRYWINNAEITVYSPQDPLQGWYWLDGRQFNASHRRGLYGRLERYTGPSERCAMIHESKSVSWKDMPCNKSYSFVCKKRKRIKSTSGSDMDSKEVKAKIKDIISRRFHKGKINKGANMELLQLAKNKSFRGSFKTTRGDGTVGICH
ncbi:Hypothetical predicted protein [Paramuricea clavata]|uniref:Uncharacterized protein n=1 Tax=Paramuricea clavata TaxID=317549 RepID=A0A7D9D8S0_PARCT|nr:Hypothetical predicted protein [Paramuricea clavata]